MPVEVRDNREDPGVRIRLVLVLAGAFLMIVALAMFGLHHYYRVGLSAKTAPQSLGSFPVPQLQPNPTGDYREFHRRQSEQLSGYAWVDRDRDLVHVPIERAMDFVVSRGSAALDPLTPSSAEPNSGTPPDGAPRSSASLPASPYGARP